MQAPELDAACPACRPASTSAARRQSRIAIAGTALRHQRSFHAAAPQAALRRLRVGQRGDDGVRTARGRSRGGNGACRRTWSARLTMRSRGSRRATPTARRVRPAVPARVLGASGTGDARHRAEAQQHGFGSARCSSTSSRLASSAAASSGWSCSPHRGRQHGGQRAGERRLRRPRSASARASVGRSCRSARRTWPSPQVGTGRRCSRPNVPGNHARRPVRRARLPLLAQAGQRRSPSSSACGTPSGWHRPAAATGRSAAAFGPGSCR